MGPVSSVKAARGRYYGAGRLRSTKLLVAIGIGTGVEHLFRRGGIFGLSGTWRLGIDNSNGGLYAALVVEFGNERDVIAISILSLNDGLSFVDDCAGRGRKRGMANIPIMALRWRLLSGSASCRHDPPAILILICAIF